MDIANSIIEPLKKAIDNYEKVYVTGSDGQREVTRIVYPYYLWVSKTADPIIFMRCYPETSDRFEDWDVKTITKVTVSSEKIDMNISAPFISYGEDICEIIYPK